MRSKRKDYFINIIGIKYICTELRSTFTVINFDKAGWLKGQLTMGKTIIPVQVFAHSNAPIVKNQFDFCFAGADINPNEFVGGVGNGQIESINPFEKLVIGGAFPTHIGVSTFKGIYVRTY